jgi:hypothetical protein
MIFEVAEILSRLAKKRPIFHSEADFQHALAWEVRGMHADADIRLEVPVPLEGRAPCLRRHDRHARGQENFL